MPTRRIVRCQEFVELVTEYADNALPFETRRAFEAHLVECPGCAEYLEQMGSTVEVLGSLSRSKSPAGYRNRLLSIIRRANDGR